MNRKAGAVPSSSASTGAPRVASADVVVRNAQGMHLRPATEFARLAMSTGCRVRVRAGESEVNGASVLELAMLAIGNGTTLSITTEGERCEEAVQKLVALVQNGFSPGARPSTS